MPDVTYETISWKLIGQLMANYQTESRTKKLTAIEVRIPLAAISADIGLPNAQPEVYKNSVKYWKFGKIFFSYLPIVPQ